MSNHNAEATPSPTGCRYVALYDEYGSLLAIGPKEADAFFRAKKLGVILETTSLRQVLVGEDEHLAWWNRLGAAQKTALREQGDVPPLT